MANLKLDLVNKLNNDKFYAELELVRLAQEPNMNYRNKIDTMDYQLGELALLNGKLGLVEQYFKDEDAQGAPIQADAPPAPPPAPEPQKPPAAPETKKHEGQSHNE